MNGIWKVGTRFRGGSQGLQGGSGRPGRDADPVRRAMQRAAGRVGMGPALAAVAIAALAVTVGGGSAIAQSGAQSAGNVARTYGVASSSVGATPDQADLIAYEPIDRWPQRSEAAVGLFQSPVDLDVALDGHVYIADAGVGGVHVLRPSGEFAVPFGVTGGFPAQLGQVGKLALGFDPTRPGTERAYVIDPALDRIAIYASDGTYSGQWEDVPAAGIAVSMDGRAFVLDGNGSRVRVINAFSGLDIESFGERGTGDGQFSSFSDVSVSPDGASLAVADRRGQRVQIFDVASDAELAEENPSDLLTLRQSYDLLDARFNLGGNTCRATSVSALGGDAVFVGEGTSACIVDGRDVTFAIASSAENGTICRSTVRMPRLQSGTQQYFALATYNPNSGKCDAKRTELDTTPVVVEYDDQELRGVATIWEAASNEDSDNPVLFSPTSLSMPSEGVVFVEDSSAKLRFFALDGEQIATSARSSTEGDFTSDFKVFQVLEAVGSDVIGEIFGFYFDLQRGQQGFQVNLGIGRFQTVEDYQAGEKVEVIEPIWTDELYSSFTNIEIPAIAYNPITNELLALRNDRVAQQRTEDVRIVRYAPDGTSAGDDWDLPDDGKTNPYIDMAVAPDGRVMVLNDIDDVVLVYEPDGTFVVEVPVAFDARQLAGGPQDPAGDVFVLREPGVVERYASSGDVTSRFDARALPFSDPTTLADLVVDGSGRVYVADGQSSLITVFEASQTGQSIPIPDGPTCVFAADSLAEPAALDVGGSTTVSLALDGRCGVYEDPTDIVIVVPYLGQLQAGVDPSSATITDLLRLVGRVDFGQHRVGIVSYWNTTNVEQPLTTDRDEYAESVRDLRRFNPPNENVKPRLKSAMDAAGELYDDSSRRRVMVLLRPEYCSADNEFYPGQCAGYLPAEETAAELRQSGVQIIALQNPGAFDLASSDEDALFDLDGAHRRMVRYELPDTVGTAGTIAAMVSSALDVDPGSLGDNGTWSAPEASWSMDRLDAGGTTVSLTLRAPEAGTWPVFDQAVARLVDGWGNERQIELPIPSVSVEGEAATPEPTVGPTAMPTAEPTAVPTLEPRPSVLFLPVVHAARCQKTAVPLDVVLVIDRSSSMNEPTEPGGESKIGAARAAADQFISELRSQDYVAVVTFDREAKVVVPLTADRAGAQEAVARIETGFGTRIDRGLEEAIGLLQDRRSSSEPVIVMLTDGRPSGGYDQIVPLAAEARTSGVAIYTIGLGPDVDAALLEAVAGSPGSFLMAPDAEDLDQVYEALLSQELLICR